MNLSQERTCWGVARTALALFLLCILLVYLFGGFDPAAVRAS
ncbi:hypothetical protein [Xanthobacter pseudotagetidis]